MPKQKNKKVPFKVWTQGDENKGCVWFSVGEQVFVLQQTCDLEAARWNAERLEVALQKLVDDARQTKAH